jgi:ankyrin repeat protein
MKKKRAHIVSKHEDTIFDAFSSLRLHGACLKNQRDIVERLVEEEDEDVNRRVPKDFTIARRRLTTPLIISSRAGHTEIVKYLLKRGALVNAVSGNGASALYIACQEGQTDCVEHLIKGGADLNQREKTRGAPPIFAAAQFNFVECVKLLKQAGCDTSLKTKTNSTAIVIAAQEGYHKIVELLLPASFTQLYKSAYLCASHGYADILNTLMGPKGLRQHSKTQKVLFLSKCLEAAVKAQSPPCIRILTSQNVDLDPKKLDDAVHFAATEGYVECMRALIDAGASRKIAKKAAKQAANEKCLAALPKKGFIKGGASKLKKWFRKRATSTNNNSDDDAKRRDDGLVVTAPSPPASPAHRYRSPPTSPKVWGCFTTRICLRLSHLLAHAYTHTHTHTHTGTSSIVCKQNEKTRLTNINNETIKSSNPDCGDNSGENNEFTTFSKQQQKDTDESESG